MKVSDLASKRSVGNLARALAKRCRGRTLLLGRAFPQLVEALEARNTPLATRAAEELELPIHVDRDLPARRGAAADGADGFDTVVLARTLEYATPEGGRALVYEARRRLKRDGRLIVCVPNDDCVDDGQDVVQRFNRRRLKRLLKEVGWPKLDTDQPYRWLVMHVDASPPLDRTTRERHRVIARLCRGNVLELGCGPGHLSRAIARRGLTVAGVDKNRAKIAAAREQYPEIPFTCADILDLPDAPLHDTVVLAEVLEHVAPDVGDRMLSRAWRRVAPGGRLVVSVPNEDCVRHPNHVQEFNRRELKRLLARLGRSRTVAEQPFKWLLMYVDRPV